MSKKYNLIVVGGGPAGLMEAKTAGGRSCYGDCDYTVPYPLRSNPEVILSNDELCYFLGLFKEHIPFSSKPFTAALSMSGAMEKEGGCSNRENG